MATNKDPLAQLAATRDGAEGRNVAKMPQLAVMPQNGLTVNADKITDLDVGTDYHIGADDDPLTDRDVATQNRRWVDQVRELGPTCPQGLDASLLGLRIADRTQKNVIRLDFVIGNVA